MSEGLDPILQQKEQQQLKTQLLWRLGIAGGLIAAILFGIAWIEKSQENPAPSVQIPQIAPELNASEPAEITPAASAPVTTSPTPTEQANATPSPSNTPTPTPTPTTTNAQNNSSPIQKIENAPKPTSANPKQAPSIRPEAKPLLVATAIPLKPDSNNAINNTGNSNKTIANTPAQPINKAPPIQAAPDFPNPVSNPHGYSVQAGVFLHSNNAEKLLGQLQQAGIPAYLETRVQIGPFKSKIEADIAIKKLKALGITPILKTE